MVRIIIATLLGAIVYYIWGMAAWMALPLHTPTLHTFDDEDAVHAILKQQKPKPGYYTIPGMPKEFSSRSAEDLEKWTKEWTAKHKEGPVVSIIISPGSEPMDASVLAGGGVIDVVAAFIASLLLSGATCCRMYIQRVGFVLGLGLFSAVISHAALWNWMSFPLDWTIAMIIDTVVGWTLVGLVMAAIIRPKAKVSPEQS